MIYSDPIIRKYIELIKASTNVFNSVYQGDPFRIPKSNLPALLISKTQTQVKPLTNSEDSYTIGLTMTVITDIRDERSDDQQVTPGIAQLYDIIEGRDETTYKLKTNSLLNILRTNIAVDTAYNLRTDLGSITRVDYGMTIGKRTPEGYSTEGQIDFIATYSQIR